MQTINFNRYQNFGTYFKAPYAGALSDSQKENHKYSELSADSLANAINKFRADLIEAKQAILDGIAPCVPIITTNRKLNGIYTVKTLPVLTCDGICGKCVAGCYAVKLNNLFAGSRAVCAHNTAVLELNPEAYFTGIEDFCKTVTEFRWHESGEVTNDYYMRQVISIAANCPNCDFLLYTKRLNLLGLYAGMIHSVKNLHTVASCMDYDDLTNTANLGFPRTVVNYSHDGVSVKYKKAFRLPDNSNIYECKSDCSICKKDNIGCWNKESDYITVFEAH